MTHPDSNDLPPFDAALDDDIRALVAEAAALPTLRPSRDLWPGIAARLDARDAAPPAPHASADPAPADARVLAFPTAGAAHRASPGQPIARRWLAAAAVALVAISSGTTYLAVRTPSRGARTVAVAQPAAGTGELPSQPVASASTGTQRVAATAPSGIADTAVAPARDRGEAAPPRAVRAVSRSVDAAVPGAVDYDREIAVLRAAVAERRGDLDSATVDVLVHNLRIIDAAIAASRAALARDPHSPFLGEQLTRALGQKVELLRTAALLPST